MGVFWRTIKNGKRQGYPVKKSKWRKNGKNEPNSQAPAIWKREAARETPRDPSLVAKHVLKARPDFMAERSELELLLADRGHILVMSPKCHPELAGQG
eukprot:SAG22_NODE_13489_length_404_cov_11.101639_1_plen_97_part_01